MSLKNLKLRSQIIWIFMIFFLFIISFSGITYYYYSYSNITQSYKISSEDVLGQIKDTVAARLNAIESHAKALLTNNSFDLSLLRYLTTPSDRNTVVTMGDIADYLRTFQMGEELLSSSIIYTDKQAFDMLTEIRNQEFDFKESVFYAASEQQSAKSVVWFPAMEDQIYSKTRTVIPCVRQFRVIGYVKNLYMVYQLDQEQLKNLVTGPKSFFDQIIIMDSGGSPIIGEDLTGWDAVKDLDVSGILQGNILNDRVSIGDSNYLVTGNYIKMNGWIIFGLKDESEMIESLSAVKTNILILALVTAVISMSMLLVVSGKMTKALSDLEEKMSCARDGDLDVRFFYPYKNEIGSLADSFNYMLYEIQKLVEAQQCNIKELKQERNRVVEIQKQKRKAELQALQAQINPHFLYNTLNAITWQAADCGAEDVCTLSSNLGKFFRISLSKGAEIITISEELEQVESYLNIQSIRYQNKLEFSINVSEDIREFYTLKLILQPLVENAIYHGIKEKKGKGRIEIRAELRDDEPVETLVLYVWDNGIGISEEKLEVLNAGLQNSAMSQKEGYGIYNVNERIQLYYGRQYGLHFTSKEKEYTQVEIRIPVKPQEVDDVQDFDCR